MTEDGMKLKWCPHVRLIAGTATLAGTVEVPAGQPHFNRVIPSGNQQMIPAAARCIGSACSQWQWYPSGAADPDLPREFPDTPQLELNKLTDVGYCGMARRPL